MIGHGDGDPLSAKGSSHSLRSLGSNRRDSLRSFGDGSDSSLEEGNRRPDSLKAPRPSSSNRRTSYSSFNGSYADPMERDSSLNGLEEQAAAMGALMGQPS